ncbi:hypothetical protein DFH29DRAFT_975011, partial [Suillus ampliporus]
MLYFGSLGVLLLANPLYLHCLLLHLFLETLPPCSFRTKSSSLLSHPPSRYRILCLLHTSTLLCIPPVFLFLSLHPYPTCFPCGVPRPLQL